MEWRGSEGKGRLSGTLSSLKVLDRPMRAEKFRDETIKTIFRPTDFRSTSTMNSDKELFNISRRECLEVYPRIFENSSNNWNAATLLAKNKYYGQAVSLATASIEELIKCIIILLDGLGFDFRKTKGVNRFFKEHDIRYYTAFLLMSICIFGEELLIHLEKWIKDPKALFDFEKKSKDLEYMESVINKFLEAKMKLIEQELPFFRNMNLSRLKGLYCDYDQTFHSPAEITLETYQETKARLEKVRTLGIFIIGLFKAEAPEIQEQTKLIVKSFKENQFYDKLSMILQNKRTAMLFEQSQSYLDNLGIGGPLIVRTDKK